MIYSLLRKDLVSIDTKCEFCNRTLKSGKAYLLISDLGSYVFAGKHCAIKNSSNGEAVNKLPNLTRYTISPEDETDHAPIVIGGHGGRPLKSASDDYRKAVEYLILRQQLLRPYLPSISYSGFDEYYLSYQNNTIDEKAIRHIVNIENKAPTKLKLSTLQKCYNYIFWIDVAIDKIGEEHQGIPFLQGVRKHLVKNYSITNDQKDGVNKWLQHIESVALLK